MTSILNLERQSSFSRKQCYADKPELENWEEEKVKPTPSEPKARLLQIRNGDEVIHINADWIEMEAALQEQENYVREELKQTEIEPRSLLLGMLEQ